MTELLTLGEPIVTFASKDLGAGLVDSIDYYKLLGGAELNVLIGAARLGHSTEYISQVGQDPLGDFAIKNIKNHQVGTTYIESDPNNWTAFQLKELVAEGDPQTFNFRKNSAAAHLKPAVIDEIDFSGVKIGHLSGIFPAISRLALATFEEFATKLLEHGILTTFDPNLRPALWDSEAQMIETINQLARFGQIVLPGINEGKILVGSDDPETIADFYLHNGDQTRTVVVKLGEAGAYLKNKGDKQGKIIPGFRAAKVVDTVGAGDGFALGLITGLLDQLSLEAAVERGNAVGALQVQTPGDNDGYPTPTQLQEFLIAQKGV